MAEKRKYVIHHTPRGTLVWPHLNTPDTYKDKTEYKTNLRVAVADFVELKEIIDANVDEAINVAIDMDTGKPLSPGARAKAIAKGPSYCYRPAVDKDGKEIEGFVDLTFKIAHMGRDRNGESYSNKPKLFDCGSPAKLINVKLTSGAIVKIGFTMFPWATAALGYGVALRPKAVRVIELSKRGDADANYYFGEEAEETGYVHSEFSDPEDDKTEGGTPGTSLSDELDEDIPF